jgi:hypothetical protein
MTAPTKAITPQTDIVAYFREQATRCLAIAHAREGQPDHASFLRIAQHWHNAAESSDLYVRDTGAHATFGAFEVELT